MRPDMPNTTFIYPAQLNTVWGKQIEDFLQPDKWDIGLRRRRGYGGDQFIIKTPGESADHRKA
jgi:hypothetical protein